MPKHTQQYRLFRGNFCKARNHQHTWCVQISPILRKIHESLTARGDDADIETRNARTERTHASDITVRHLDKPNAWEQPKEWDRHRRRRKSTHNRF